MIIKRIFDIIASLFGIIILSPVFFLITFLISMTMPGPILFRQFRVGKNGVIFRLNKFRSMSVVNNSEIGSFDAGDKSRITPLGRILRKTKLDELPQLFNVLLGEMSLVGPRPEVKAWTEVYPDKWKIVHQVNPGITDNASILFRNEEEILAASPNPQETYKNEILPIKLDLYMNYVQNHTFIGDLLIIKDTFKAIIIKK